MVGENELLLSQEGKRNLLDSHLEEYKTLRKEIADLILQKSTAVNYALIVLGALPLFLPNAIAEHGEYLLLVTAIPFIGLGWYIVSIDSMILRTNRYLRNVLIPKLRALTSPSNSLDKGIGDAFEWEYHVSQAFFKGTVENLISSGRNFLLLVPIPSLVGLFFYITRVYAPRSMTGVEIFLLGLDVVLTSLLLMASSITRKASSS